MNRKKDEKSYIEKILKESSELILNSNFLISDIIRCVDIITHSLKKGNKIILFGNGGSAADAQHFAAEFIGRFEKERDAIPAISLTTDSSIITSIGNDYSFDKIFESEGIKIVCDLQSWMYLKGTNVEYSDDMLNGGFKITNPNAERTCGCGTSFSV